MGFLIVRLETESHSVYQMRTTVETGRTSLTRLPGPDADTLIDEAATVIRYQPIAAGKPFVVTITWEGVERTLISTPVQNVAVWLV